MFIFSQLLQDFTCRYPEKEDFFFSNAVLLADKLIALGRNRENETSTEGVRLGIRNLLNLLAFDVPTESNQQSDLNVIISLHLLPFLMNSIPSHRRKGGKRKKSCSSVDIRTPSRAEIRDSFICHVPVESSITNLIQARKEELRSRAMTLQPFILSVGEKIVSPEKVFISFNDILYPAPDIATAVDVTFKIFHAAHLEYPHDCHDIWLFIQKGYYKISTKYDSMNQSVKGLLADLGLLVD